MPAKSGREGWGAMVSKAPSTSTSFSAISATPASTSSRARKSSGMARQGWLPFITKTVARHVQGTSAVPAGCSHV